MEKGSAIYRAADAISSVYEEGPNNRKQAVLGTKRM
jgi:hypothetical protein